MSPTQIAEAVVQVIDFAADATVVKNITGTESGCGMMLGIVYARAHELADAGVDTGLVRDCILRGLALGTR